MNVIVYSTSTCPYCRMVKDFLTSKNIPFTEKLVDVDQTVRDEMVGISGGFMGVPYTVVDKDGVTEKVVGFDKGRLEEIFK